jgi:glucose/arabinose dehydrogenase
MNKLATIVLAGAAAAALVQTGPVGAQGAAQSAALEKRLVGAKTLSCAFTTLATGNWTGAKPTATVTEAKLEVKFTAIDIDEGTAEADGGFGASFISVRYSHGYLHFMQMSDAGPLYITTVLATPTANNRLKAMHTRHEWSPAVVPGFTSRPELYVGDCAVGATP